MLVWRDDMAITSRPAQRVRTRIRTCHLPISSLSSCRESKTTYSTASLTSVELLGLVGPFLTTLSTLANQVSKLMALIAGKQAARRVLFKWEHRTRVKVCPWITIAAYAFTQVLNEGNEWNSFLISWKHLFLSITQNNFSNKTCVLFWLYINVQWSSGCLCYVTLYSDNSGTTINYSYHNLLHFS